MKMQGKWVAWMAALALAAMLVATPREGAAGSKIPGPYIMPEPPGPVLGEPDVPGGSPQQIQTGGFLLRLGTYWIWVRTTPAARGLAGPAKRDVAVRARRTVR